MQYQPLYSTPVRRRTMAVPIALAVLSLLFVLALLAWFSSRATSAVTQLPESAVLAVSWQVDVPTVEAGPHFGGKLWPGQVFFVPAGEPFHLQPEPAGAHGYFAEAGSAATWDHDGGELNPPADVNGTWTQTGRAPQQPGLYQLVWYDTPEQTGQTLQVLVLGRGEHNSSGGKTTVKVNGQSIGQYLDPSKSPVKRVRENPNLYAPPQFFTTIEGLENLKLGPDFVLGDLIAFKDYYGSDGKKVYTTERHTNVLPPRPELIDKLVKLRQRLREKGVKVTRFWITSGFRTPDYNRRIGGAAYSRHCFGDAVDLAIDEDGDHHMDDLNGDGRLDRKDGIVIGDACRELEAEGSVVPGGIGVYEWAGEESVRSHVHIDCRGFPSRWGTAGKRSFVWWPKSDTGDDDGGD
jgi:hypothetical protein